MFVPLALQQHKKYSSVKDMIYFTGDTLQDLSIQLLGGCHTLKASAVIDSSVI